MGAFPIAAAFPWQDLRLVLQLSWGGLDGLGRAGLSSPRHGVCERRVCTTKQSADCL